MMKLQDSEEVEIVTSISKNINEKIQILKSLTETNSIKWLESEFGELAKDLSIFHPSWNEIISKLSCDVIKYDRDNLLLEFTISHVRIHNIESGHVVAGTVGDVVHTTKRIINTLEYMITGDYNSSDMHPILGIYTDVRFMTCDGYGWKDSIDGQCGWDWFNGKIRQNRAGWSQYFNHCI